MVPLIVPPFPEVVVHEYLLAPVPTLGHMVGDAGYDDAWKPRHGHSLSRAGNGVNSKVSP